MVSAGRPGLQQGIAPALIGSGGYLSALVAGGLLISSRAGAPDGTRRIGPAVLAAGAVLVLLDLLVSNGPKIGAGDQPDAYHLAQMLVVDGHPTRGTVAGMLR